VALNLAAVGSDWTLAASIMTFAIPVALFVVVATVLYFLYTRPHTVPGHRDLVPAAGGGATGSGRHAAGAPRPAAAQQPPAQRPPAAPPPPPAQPPGGGYPQGGGPGAGGYGRHDGMEGR
jgi:hypothetical protein